MIKETEKLTFCWLELRSFFALKILKIRLQIEENTGIYHFKQLSCISGSNGQHCFASAKRN